MLDTFAKRLEWIRRERGMTRHELAEASGVSYGSIFNYESGTYEPALRAAALLADTLCVSLDWLTGRDCDA